MTTTSEYESGSEHDDERSEQEQSSKPGDVSAVQSLSVARPSRVDPRLDDVLLKEAIASAPRDKLQHVLMSIVSDVREAKTFAIGMLLVQDSEGLKRKAVEKCSGCGQDYSVLENETAPDGICTYHDGKLC
jgi:hypothetical protein